MGRGTNSSIGSAGMPDAFGEFELATDLVLTRCAHPLSQAAERLAATKITALIALQLNGH